MFVRSHWCQRKVYYLSILLLPAFICLLSLKKTWWLYGWEQTANTEPAGSWKFLSVKIRMQSGAGAQCSANKNILNWVTGCSCQSSVAADISTKMMSSAFNICLHCSTEWVCADLSLPSRQDWIASLEYTEAAAAVQNACAYLYLLDHHHAVRQKALWLQSTVGI